MAHQTIVLDEEGRQAMNRLLSSGKYADEETIVRKALVHLDQDVSAREEDLAILQWEIEKGVRSGITEGDPFERIRRRAGLPSRVVL